MDLNKQKLETLISEERTIGNYLFDEEKQCFLGDAETVLYITKVAENRYKSVCYFFDGYEIYLDEGDVEFYDGNEALCKQKAIDSFNQGKFMGYPIIFTDITCNLYEDEVEE